MSKLSSEKLKQMWADPERRAAMTAKWKATRSTPEYRAAASARAKAQAEKRRLAKQQKEQQVAEQKPTGHIVSGSVVPTISSILGNPNNSLVYNILEQKPLKKLLEHLTQEEPAPSVVEQFREEEEDARIQELEKEIRNYKFGDNR